MSYGGLPDPSGIAYLLSRLTRSPRVQFGVSQLKNIIPKSFGPLVAGPRIQQNNRRGSTPNIPNPDPGGVFGGIAGALGQTIGNLNQVMNPDPMTVLYNQLLDQLQSPVNTPTGIDTEDLMRQVQEAINPIYNQREQAAQGRYNRASSETKDMYRTLASDYERLAPEQAKQAAQAQKDIEALYGQLRSNIEGSYSRVSKEQADEFKQLGIESALPDVLDEQQAPVQDALTAASELQAQQEQRYEDIGQMDQTYYREQSPIATMAGNELRQGFMNQLNDYLDQLDSERAGNIQSAYMDQLGQAQNSLLQQQQFAQNESSRRQEMLWQILQSQMQGQQQQSLNPDSFMGQLPPQVQQSVAGAFTQLQRSPEAVYGKVQDPRNPVPGTFVETTPEWYMSQADKMLQQGQIDPVTHQALLMYLQLYFGAGK